MITEIQGLHHVTSIASDAGANNRFFTQILGLRRIKKTVNFDAPQVYHLYYGDTSGTPGSVMTYFPYGDIPRGQHGSGEVSITDFAAPKGSLQYWQDRLSAAKIPNLTYEFLGDARLEFDGPDGERFAIQETDPNGHAAWTGADITESYAIYGFQGLRQRLSDIGPTQDLLHFMGYETIATEGPITRLQIPNGNAANIIDLEQSNESPATQGAGSVHHIAFSVTDSAAQLRVRQALIAAGHQVTPVIDRDYFWAIYFRSPGGVLFEVATEKTGFATDEDLAILGQDLKLPTEHEHLCAELEDTLPQL